MKIAHLASHSTWKCRGGPTGTSIAAVGMVLIVSVFAKQLCLSVCWSVPIVPPSDGLCFTKVQFHMDLKTVRQTAIAFGLGHLLCVAAYPVAKKVYFMDRLFQSRVSSRLIPKSLASLAIEIVKRFIDWGDFSAYNFVEVNEHPFSITPAPVVWTVCSSWVVSSFRFWPLLDDN